MAITQDDPLVFPIACATEGCTALATHLVATNHDEPEALCAACRATTLALAEMGARFRAELGTLQLWQIADEALRCQRYLQREGVAAEEVERAVVRVWDERLPPPPAPRPSFWRRALARLFGF